MIKLCSVDGCVRHSTTKGMCGAHYARMRRGAPLNVPLKRYNPRQGCSVEGCDGKHNSKGLCRKHYYETRKPYQNRPEVQVWKSFSYGKIG